MKSRENGITLIELVFALAIIGILFAIALPTVSNATEAVRASDARTSLVSSLIVVLDKATILGVQTVLCPSGDGEHCDAGDDWSAGWIGFLDTHENRQRTADELVITRVAALAGKVRLHSTPGRTRIVFQPFGGNAGSNVTFTLCDGRGPAKAVSLVLSNEGRLRNGIPSAAEIEQTCPQ